MTRYDGEHTFSVGSLVKELVKPRTLVHSHALSACSFSILCFAVFSALASTPAPAREPYIASSWTHKDGLPSTLIYAIAQTRNGYLWLGTSDGLVRFDGITFVHQRLISTPDLLVGAVTALAATKDGALWIGSASGLITRMSGSSLQKYRLKSAVEAIVESSETDVWVIADSGLYRFESVPRGELKPAGELDAASFIQLLSSTSAAIVLGHETHPLAGAVPAIRARKVTLSGRTFVLNEGENGSVWLGSHSSLEKRGLPIVERDRRGYVWAGGAIAGLMRTSDEGWRLEPDLENHTVESLFEDREGNIWVGTNNGLYRFRYGKVFLVTKSDGLCSDSVSSVESTGHVVWVGTQDGLSRIRNSRVRQCLRGLDVLTLRASRNHDLWVGTRRGVFKISDAEGIAKPQLISKDLSSVTAIEEDSAGCVWFLNAGKALYRWRNGVLVSFGADLKLGTRTITTIRAQNDGTLWIGFFGGGVGFYKQDSFHEFSTATGPISGAIYDVYVEAADAVWFATETGLYRFNGTKFSVWSPENGLPGYRVLWLQTQGGDTLWLGFTTGVARLRRSDMRVADSALSRGLQCEIYDFEDGLSANPIRLSQAPVTLDAEGKLWFTTSEGMAGIDSRHIEKNLVPPPVVIERVIADNRPSPVGSLLQFPPLTRNLEIDYAGLSLAIPRKVQFRYQLMGYDKTWQDVGDRRQAFYTNLQPGAYRFRVIAANNDGVWNENGATVDLSILPAFYQTRLFKVFCLAALGVIGWSIYRFRLRQLQGEWQARLEERLTERTRIARDLHDELLQDAMGVSLQIELIDSLIPEPHTAKPHLQRALALSRALLQTGRQVLRNLREKTHYTSDLTGALSKTIEEFQRTDGPAASLTVQGTARAINPIVAEELLQVGSQAIANAFQHAKAKRIEVYLMYKPNELRLEVDDNGCGIDPGVSAANKPGHYGLIGMKERTERIRGTLTITSRTGEGTKVTVLVPGKHAYRETKA